MHDKNLLWKAYRLMFMAKEMSETYDANRSVARYVHATSRGHEAIQLATAFQLTPSDWVSPYYRDDCMLLGLGWEPYDLMLQLLAKAGDPFSGGRAYYCHPNATDADKPKIIHQSSATGMQAIPTTGLAQGIQYLEKINRLRAATGGEAPVVICSLGDSSMTEGEVSEALQFAALKQLPIIYLVQDNEWGISVSAAEARAMNAYEYARGFKGISRAQVDGTDFFASCKAMSKVIGEVRKRRNPWLVHAKVCLLSHHTSGVRKEFYRNDEDLQRHRQSDPLPKLRKEVLKLFSAEEIARLEEEVHLMVLEQFERAAAAAEPAPETVADHVLAPTPVTEEKGDRAPAGAKKVIMVDAALYAIRELMEQHEECILFGQDVGRRLGGVFREAATLAEQFGDHRVFNTAIEEAYVIGSTVGLSAVGVRPIVEVQFADYLFPGLNQLVTDVSKSCFLTCGKFPVSAIIRVPVGAYGGGGPYHSACVETTLLAVKGLKIAYPSNAADMKGLMKAAFYDPNPVIMLEHKGLYWSKVHHTEDAKTPEPDRHYILPFGKGALALEAAPEMVAAGDSACVVTYGMGVYWAKEAAKRFPGSIEVVDLRTLFPLDEDLIFSTVKKHGRCLVLSEEQQSGSFAEALAGRISYTCFRWLDAPVEVLGALNLPAVPLNTAMEAIMLPDADKVAAVLERLLRD